MDASPRRRCPACGSPGLLSVVVTTDGSRVIFTICHTCEDKRWIRDDREVPLWSLVPRFRRQGTPRETKTA